MTHIKTDTSPDTLISVLKSLLNADDGQLFGYLVLYTSFGVVRGRTGLSLGQELTEGGNGEASGVSAGGDVIELHDVNVEHYSNHLPTATFKRLYVRLAEVRGFAFVEPQS